MQKTSQRTLFKTNGTHRHVKVLCCDAMANVQVATRLPMGPRHVRGLALHHQQHFHLHKNIRINRHNRTSGMLQRHTTGLTTFVSSSSARDSNAPCRCGSVSMSQASRQPSQSSVEGAGSKPTGRPPQARPSSEPVHRHHDMKANQRRQSLFGPQNPARRHFKTPPNAAVDH